MMMKRSLLIVVMAGATADASVWDRALTSPEDEAARDLYDAKMLEGDTATLTSTIQSASIRNGLESIKRAEAAYRAAAAIRPREGEPYFRIGNLLYQMPRTALQDALSVIGGSPSSQDAFAQAIQLLNQQYAQQGRSDANNAALYSEIGSILAQLFR